MSTLGFCQIGLTKEYPKRILYKGMYVTLFTDALVKKMTDFKIDYEEALSLNDSLRLQVLDLEDLYENERTANISLNLENDKCILLVQGKDEVIGLKDIQIIGIEKSNRRLTRNTGILGGVVIVLATITGILALK